jgi:hypothetical protein
MALFWLSFVDPSLPEGSQFLGACVVPGGDTGDDRADLSLAVRWSWQLGCNPGGRVKAMRFYASLEPHVRPQWRERLLTRAECDALMREVKPHAPS